MPSRHPRDDRRWRRIEPLAGDASTRRYSRLTGPHGRTSILVEYPDELRRRLERDLEARLFCRGAGLRVPELEAAEADAGWALFEDFGRLDAAATLRAADPRARGELVLAVVAPLAALAGSAPDRLPGWNPPLDRQRLRWELAGFELWYLRQLRGTAPSAAVEAWLDALADTVAAHPRRVCHRDYHLNNLFLLPAGEVGVIDYQDVLVGPDTYDVASLLDERAGPELVDRDAREVFLERWAAASRAGPEWRDRLASVTGQRALKVLGTFARLVVAGRDGYHSWMVAGARRLGGLADRLAMPAELVDLLLD